MIERYFMLGVRLKWVCPGAVGSKTKDGSIIDNPVVAASRLVYDGLDGQLYDLGAPHVSTRGLTMGMNIPYRWLVYALGHTTRLTANHDVLTGPMSGCLIAKWMDQGRRYVGHVGTVDDSATVNQRVKNTFVAAMPQNTTGFDPANAWRHDEILKLMNRIKPFPGWKIMALVTTANQFYSILMLKLTGGQQNEWCVGGIKQVPPLNFAAIRRRLTT